MKTKRAFNPDGDRYLFDFQLCTPDKGWAQFDSRQDASYYGNWINPTSLEIMSYAEGDVTRTICESVEEFRAEVERICAWHEEQDGKRPGIDAMCRDDLKSAFERVGLAHWLP